jgi:hypothetical protein
MFLGILDTILTISAMELHQCDICLLQVSNRQFSASGPLPDLPEIAMRQNSSDSNISQNDFQMF